MINDGLNKNFKTFSYARKMIYSKTHLLMSFRQIYWLGNPYKLSDKFSTATDLKI